MIYFFDFISHEGRQFVNEYSIYNYSLLVSEYACLAKASLSQGPARVYVCVAIWILLHWKTAGSLTQLDTEFYFRLMVINTGSQLQIQRKRLRPRGSHGRKIHLIFGGIWQDEEKCCLYCWPSREKENRRK